MTNMPALPSCHLISSLVCFFILLCRLRAPSMRCRAMFHCAIRMRARVQLFQNSRRRLLPRAASKNRTCRLRRSEYFPINRRRRSSSSRRKKGKPKRRRKRICRCVSRRGHAPRAPNERKQSQRSCSGKKKRRKTKMLEEWGVKERRGG